jgi:hypothetical protein
LEQLLNDIEDRFVQDDRESLTSLTGTFCRPPYNFRIFLRESVLEVGRRKAESTAHRGYCWLRFRGKPFTDQNPESGLAVCGQPLSPFLVGMRQIRIGSDDHALGGIS